MQKWEYKIIDTQNAYHTTFTIVETTETKE
jgi:hypothetical protein